MSNTIIHLDDPKSSDGPPAGAEDPEQKNRSGVRKQVLWLSGVGVVLLVSIGVTVALTAARPDSSPPGSAAGEEEGSDTTAIAATATHPYRNPSLRMTVKQLLSVEAFFETDLRAQLAGVVSKVPRSVGARVKAGDLLVQIDRQDLESELRQQISALGQAKARVDQMKARVDTAWAELDAANAAIVQAQANNKSAIARRKYRHAELVRILALVASGSIERKIGDEKQDQYEAAVEAVNATEAAIATTKAQKVAADARIKQARADVEEAKAKVGVVKAEIDKARAMLSFARITAPYDGEVVRRNVVVGTFVQNASTAHTEPMISLQRTDIVTVVMRVPDNAAPYVSRNTKAILTFDNLPGVTMYGRVTRFSPSIRDKDRTMRIKVDLWNDTTEEGYDKPGWKWVSSLLPGLWHDTAEKRYRMFVANRYATWVPSLTVGGPLGAASLLAAADDVSGKNTKDLRDPLPMLPKVRGNKGPVRLIPGMSGFMRLTLKEFKGAYVLPSGAVFTQGGKPYILTVRDGTTHLVPVRIQIRDGRWTKVAVVLQEANPQEGRAEVLGELTGNEVVIVSRQVEIGDGAEVSVTLKRADDVMPAKH